MKKQAETKEKEEKKDNQKEKRKSKRQRMREDGFKAKKNNKCCKVNRPIKKKKKRKEREMLQTQERRMNEILLKDTPVGFEEQDEAQLVFGIRLDDTMRG